MATTVSVGSGSLRYHLQLILITLLLIDIIVHLASSSFSMEVAINRNSITKNNTKTTTTEDRSPSNSSMAILVVDVRPSGVSEFFAHQVRRVMEVTNLPVEVWLSKATRNNGEAQDLFRELNETGRFLVRTMKENHDTFGNTTIDLQGIMGGHIGKSHALKESFFDVPLLLDGDVWPCNDEFVYKVIDGIVNGNEDVLWTRDRAMFGGAKKRSFVDPRVANHLDHYETFVERNSGTLVAVRRTNPAVQSWLALAMDIYAQQFDAHLLRGSGGYADQPAFREAFYIHRHDLVEGFPENACRYSDIFGAKCTCKCNCTSCSLIHGKGDFRRCQRAQQS